MSDLGQILNSHTIKFERTLPCSIEQAWHYFTSPEGIASWLYANAITDQKVGGRIALHFAHQDPDSRHLYVVKGRISEYAPPNVIAYSWFETSVDLTSKVRFELEARGDKTALTITHSYISPEFMPKVGAGWHSHIEALVAVLKGEKPPDQDQMARYNELLKIYTAAVATALIAASTISPAVASPSDPAYKALSDQRQELLHQYDRVWKEADDVKYEINQLRRDSHEFTRAESDLERELQYKNDDLHRIENTIHDLDKAMI
ncbi:MAG TPA: SRPBCC family protein [Trichormus sp.]|jgi:uncharacterized protein YndB with AHSA1/START domain